MTAFELVNYCAGRFLNQMFDLKTLPQGKKKQKESLKKTATFPTEFTSNLRFEEILRKLKEALMKYHQGFVQIEKETNTFAAEFIISNKGRRSKMERLVKMSVHIFELTKDFYFLHFHREEVIIKSQFNTLGIN